MVKNVWHFSVHTGPEAEFVVSLTPLQQFPSLSKPRSFVNDVKRNSNTPELYTWKVEKRVLEKMINTYHPQ